MTSEFLISTENSPIRLYPCLNGRIRKLGRRGQFFDGRFGSRRTPLLRHPQMNEYSCSLSVTLVLARNLRSISEQESRIAFGLGLADDSPPNHIRTDGDISWSRDNNVCMELEEPPIRKAFPEHGCLELVCAGLSLREVMRRRRRQRVLILLNVAVFIFILLCEYTQY